MAVRTNQAGVINKRTVTASQAQVGTGATRGKKTLPRDDAAAYKREKNLENMKPGPAAKLTAYKRGRAPTSISGRKKAPSEMGVKHKGGPHKKSRLHGG
jgi:hypothetical protein